MATIGASIATATVPDGFYDSLEGKSGDALKAAVKTVMMPSGFTPPDYGTSTWDAFVSTDIRTIDGYGQIWWDMYSNEIVTTAEHDALNIEHSVANSWWGGDKKTGAYKDLFHLNPSYQDANVQKSNLPLGIVATAAYDNGLVKTGAPQTGTAGTATKVFEPADEYKGDFARAYFYIFTAYDDITWKTDQPLFSMGTTVSLEPWAASMLAEWAKNDPVDTKEIERNDRIHAIQNNRNPFIDHPELIDYIWGSRKGEEYRSASPAEPVDRPDTPRFTGKWMRGVNTYVARWWNKTLVPVEHIDGDLWISLDGGEYQQYGPGIEIPAATVHGQTLTIAAYTEIEKDGLTLRSSVARLTLTARDPEVTDYTDALWTRVAEASQFTASDPRDYYILLSTGNQHIMGATGGTSSKKFMPDGGFVKFSGEKVSQLPADAALMMLEPTESEKYLVRVCDGLGTPKGYWNMATSGNNNTLNATTGTAATVDFGEEGDVIIDFGTKKLKYNSSQPRFTNYGDNSSTARPVALYRFDGFPDPSGIALPGDDSDSERGIAVDGRDILLPDGWLLFDIDGRGINGRNLMPGIYIAVSKNGKSTKIIIR